MKNLLRFASLLPLTVISLSSCTIHGIVFPLPPDMEHAEKRLVSEEDYLVDFSKGGSDSFFFAHGYSNGKPFNCIWNRKAGTFENGTLNLSVYKDSNKERFYGAEYRSMNNDFHYGYYATKMKPADCSGVISSFFTYTYYPSWDEIDIEFLGKNMRQVQFNYFKSGKGHAFLYSLWFDASKDFHEYGFEWLPETITWYIDGIKVYQVNVEIPTNPQMLMMNVWNCISDDNWSGVLDESKLPTKAQYQWIAYIPAE